MELCLVFRVVSIEMTSYSGAKAEKSTDVCIFREYIYNNDTYIYLMYR